MALLTDVACYLCLWQGTSAHKPSEAGGLFRCPSCSSLSELSKAVGEAVRRAGLAPLVLDPRPALPEAP
jgi:hypothetical protein